MKKVFSLIIAVLFCFAAQAQFSTPRYGTTGNQDNTGRTLTYGFKAITDGTAADTLLIMPNAWKTVYRISMTDSLSVKFITLAHCYTGDQIQFVVTGVSGKLLKFITSNWISAGNLTLTTNGSAIVTFVFNGTKWVEASRINI